MSRLAIEALSVPRCPMCDREMMVKEYGQNILTWKEEWYCTCGHREYYRATFAETRAVAEMAEQAADDGSASDLEPCFGCKEPTSNPLKEDYPLCDNCYNSYGSPGFGGRSN